MKISLRLMGMILKSLYYSPLDIRLSRTSLKIGSFDITIGIKKKLI